MNTLAQAEAHYSAVVHHANVHPSLSYVARKTGLTFRETERLLETALQRGDLAAGDYAGRKLDRYLEGKGQELQQEVERLHARIAELEAQAQPKREPQPRLVVRIASFPESNGKRNWTALLTREEKWDGLRGNCGGMTLARGEYWNRVAYEAERARFLLGQRDTEPFILDYGDDIPTPEQWHGENKALARGTTKEKQG